MARPVRVEYEGAIYHLMGRGNERKRIFLEEEDYRLFLGTMEEAVGRFGLEVHGYCLMANHYHVMAGTPRGNLSRAWGWLQTAFTIRYNRKHRRAGHLFQGRFKAQVVEADTYAQQLLPYVHLNPIRKKEEGRPVIRGTWNQLEAFKWSSHAAYRGQIPTPVWLKTDWLHYWDHRGPKLASKAYTKCLRRMVDGKESPESWEKIQKGWMLGKESFEERVKKMAFAKKGQDETKWRKKEEVSKRASKLKRVLDEETDARWKMWLRVKGCGERLVDVGREMGYQSGGAAVLEHIKNLEKRALKDAKISQKLQRYRDLIFES